MITKSDQTSKCVVIPNSISLESLDDEAGTGVSKDATVPTRGVNPHPKVSIQTPLPPVHESPNSLEIITPTATIRAATNTVSFGYSVTIYSNSRSSAKAMCYHKDYR